MKTSIKQLLETIIREELSVLREDWGDNGIGPKEKKQFVEQLKLMFSCLYDDLAYELNKAPINAQGLINKIFDKILDTDKYQDPNYNIRCYGKGNVYQLVTDALNANTATDTAKDSKDSLLFQSPFDTNNLVTPPPGHITKFRIRGTITDWYGQQVKQPYYEIREFPDRRSFTMNPLSFLKMWAGPGGVTADKIIAQLKRLSKLYDIEQVQKYYKISKNGNVVLTFPVSVMVPKFKRGDANAIRNNFIYLTRSTDIIKQIKLKTSLRERLRVAKWIIDNILKDPSDWWVLDTLFDKNDQIDVLQVFSARSSSVKDLSDMGGPVDAKDQEAYYKFFANRYKDQKKEYDSSWAAMQKDPWSEKGRAHLYKYNMFRGYDENRHTYNLIAGILGGMIPFVGPLIGGTIFSADADQYFQEGDTINGTVSGVFALLPFVPAIVRLVPGISELGAKGMFKLSEKMSKLTSNSYVLTKLEEQVLQGLRKYQAVLGPELEKAIAQNAKKYIYNVHRKFIGNPLSYSPTLMKIASWAASGSYKFGKLIKNFAPYLAIGPTVSTLSNTEWWKNWEAKLDEEDYMEEIDKTLKDAKFNQQQKKEFRKQLERSTKKSQATSKDELQKSIDSQFKTF